MPDSLTLNAWATQNSALQSSQLAHCFLHEKAANKLINADRKYFCAKLKNKTKLRWITQVRVAAGYHEPLGPRMDKPKLLGTAEDVDTRLSQIDQPHIAALTEFVRNLRIKMGPEASIPFFDPWDGGIEAEVLFLLEAPGSKARNSGFISRNNPDETAKNLFEISREAGIDRKRTITWNVVPWYIGSGSRIRPANSKDIDSGIESLAELIGHLPRLRAIVLVGGKAQKAEWYVQRVAPRLKIFTSPHPSPLYINRKPENRALLLEKWRTVQIFLESR